MIEKKSVAKTGLARTVSKLGYCSRSHATELIRTGRVRLNGKVCRDPQAPVFGKQAQILVDGKLIEPQKKIYFMLNKPRGIVTTASDEKGRETVYTMLTQPSARGTDLQLADLQTKNLPWLAPVGRLDKASEGLLLLTNDSEWAARITAPETHLDKTYHVQIAALADEELVQSLVRGVRAKDGQVLRAKKARLLRLGEKNSWLEIILDEGKNRQIRRMMEAVGIEVLRLLRVAIGPLQLGKLAKGEHRALIPEAKRMLDRAMRKQFS
ncbi:MAG: pseudouridine synthase [Candidatus Sulfotelmatobacter sp.]